MKPERRIPVGAAVIGDEERALITECLDTHWVSSQGKFVRQFEEELGAYVACRHGVALSSGTAALHVAALALGLKAGDEVLVSASTNMASAFAMFYTGAVPVPVDVDRDTWQMDARLLESKVTARTKAIEVVHLFGEPVDMDPVMAVARRHGLRVIEDCAEALGARYRGRPVGAIGDIGCFSFFANKIITTGEGGMVTTNDPALAEAARQCSNFYYGKKQKFMHEDVGYNYRMPNVSAAMGLGQLRRIDAIHARKRQIAEHYRRRLAGVAGLRLPVTRPWSSPVLWMFNLAPDRCFSLGRDALTAQLAARGIETREAFVPLNRQKVFLERDLVKENDCPVANELMDTGFYLPSGLSLTPEDLDYVCDAILALA